MSACYILILWRYGRNIQLQEVYILHEERLLISNFISNGITKNNSLLFANKKISSGKNERTKSTCSSTMWFQVQCSQIFFLIISLITFNPLLTGDVESSQATTVHFLCCFSVAKSCPTLCSPMDCSTSGFCPSLSPRVCSNSCPLGW